MAADGGMATGSSKHMPQAAEEMVGIAKVMLYTLPKPWPWHGFRHRPWPWHA